MLPHAMLSLLCVAGGPAPFSCTPCPQGWATPPGGKFTNSSACSVRQPTPIGTPSSATQPTESLSVSQSGTLMSNERGMVHAAAACPRGYFYLQPSQRCQLCPKGSYSAGSTTECRKCHRHYTTAARGATSADATSADECTGCAPGYGSRVDSPSCLCGVCLQGTYSG